MRETGTVAAEVRTLASGAILSCRGQRVDGATFLLWMRVVTEVRALAAPTEAHRDSGDSPSPSPPPAYRGVVAPTVGLLAGTARIWFLDDSMAMRMR